MKMKLASYIYNKSVYVGAVIGDEIIHCENNKNVPKHMLEFLTLGEKALDAMHDEIEKGSERLSCCDVMWLPPIPRPGKFLGIGLNYADHINETGKDRPQYPTFFTKQSTCVIGHKASIICPKISEKVDYEGELAFVIGKECKHVSKEQAKLYIAGYTIVNDVTVRDWQARSPTWTLGKSFDTHGPIGPWIVTSEELTNPHHLNLKTWVDGELRQNSNTKNMIYNCYEMVEYLSTVMTLEPGDVVTTGTPSGVGVKMKPRGYLKPGQTVKVEIEQIGVLENSVIAES